MSDGNRSASKAGGGDKVQPVEDFVRERNAALTALDMDYARAHAPFPMSDEVLLLGMHKARYECTGIAPEARRASRTWLEARGSRRIGNLPWPDGDELPGAAPTQGASR